MMSHQGQQGSTVGIEGVFLSPKLLPGLARGLLCLRAEVFTTCGMNGMKHPHLQIRTIFRLHQPSGEKIPSSAQHVFRQVDLSILSQAQGPDRICRHEEVGGTFLPPSPPAIGMLKIRQTLKGSLGHRIHFIPSRMS